MLPYALTIFVGAFLLFQVQPLIGKYILPWFGGGPGVWTACLLFFQVLLLAGYAYAHVLSRYLAPRRQALLHLVLLLGALLLLPITPGENWKPRGDGHPTLRILLLLTASVGLAYFALSATGPLLQHWFSRTHPGRTPYRLYALSNTGSLLALLTYPFYFESHLTRQAQATLWAWGLGLYAAGCGWCALGLRRAEAQSREATTHGPPATTGEAGAGNRRGGSRRLAAHRAPALAAAADHRVGSAAGRHQQALPRCGGGPVSMGGAVGAVPAELYHLL